MNPLPNVHQAVLDDGTLEALLSDVAAFGNDIEAIPKTQARQEVKHASIDLVFEADSDFNDVSAILRIRRPEDIELSDKPQVVTTPKIDAAVLSTPIPPNSYTLQVEPRQSVLIQVTCPGGEPCELDMLCANRAERWWRYDGSEGKEALGLYSIDNRTDEPLNLSFIGRPLSGGESKDAAADKATTPLVHQVRATDADYCEIGYESATVVESGEQTDYDKIRIRVHWIQ